MELDLIITLKDDEWGEDEDLEDDDEWDEEDEEDFADEDEEWDEEDEEDNEALKDKNERKVRRKELGIGV